MRQTVEINGVPRTVIVDHSFHPVEQAPQTWQVFSALLDGFERQAGIIAFLLIMGGAFQIMNSSRAIDAGIFSFLGFTKGLERYRFIKMLGVNNVVISLIIILFSLFGAVFGMSEETLAHIYDRHKVNYHSNGVGVYNVQKRLKLYYGEDYGITYESAEGKGTTATITIPGRQEAIR